MIDRLQQLRSMCDPQLLHPDNIQQQLSGSNTYMDDNHKQGIGDQFFGQIQSIKERIIILKNNNQNINNIKAKYAKAVKGAQEKQNSNQMDKILSDNAQIYQEIKQKLEKIKLQVQQAQENQPDQPQTKMKRNFYISISKEATDILRQQKNCQEEYKNTVKDKVVRQVRLIDRDIPQQQLQEYVNNPDLAQQMLQRKIYGQASVRLQNTVSDIQDKFRDIVKLEHSVEQCVQLFNQLAALVALQGQQIDSIQGNVADAKDYVEKGQKKLKQAKQHHKCSKKCMCIAIIIALVILVIAIIVIATTVSKNTSSTT